MKFVLSMIFFLSLGLNANAEKNVIIEYESPINEYYDIIYTAQINGVAGESVGKFYKLWPDPYVGLSYLHEIYDFEVSNFPEGVVLETEPTIFPDLTDISQYPGRSMDFDICISKPGVYHSFLGHRQTTYRDRTVEGTDTIIRRIYHTREGVELTFTIAEGDGRDCPNEEVETAVLSLQGVKLAQVVYNPQVLSYNGKQYYDIPLKDNETVFNAVKNKSASFEATVSLVGETKEVFASYQVIVKNAAGYVVLETKSRDISELIGQPYLKIKPDEFFPPTPLKSFVPVQSGNITVDVVVTSDKIRKSSPRVVGLNVIPTFTPKISIHKFYSSETNHLPPLDESEFQKTLQSGAYLSSIFPVSDNSIILSQGLPIKVVNPSIGVQGEVSRAPFFEDLKFLEKERKRKVSDRAVGVVKGKYFEEKLGLSNVAGINPSGFKHVMVLRQGQPDTLAHELAHSFGVKYENYATNSQSNYEPVVVGFDANPNGYFVGPYTVNGNFGIMGQKVWQSSPLATPLWIDPLTYAIIFNTLSKPTIDPETIVFSATLDKSGKISSISSYDILNGVETISEPEGEVEVRLVDGLGKTIGSKKIKADYGVFVKRTDGSSENIDLGAMPLIVEFPKIKDASGFQVAVNGKVIATSSISGGKLVGMIQDIPLEAFFAIGCINPNHKIKFAEKEKQALLILAQKAQAELDKNDFVKARLTLKALSTLIKVVMRGNYVPTNTYGLSRSAILSNINSIEKVIPSKACQKGR